MAPDDRRSRLHPGPGSVVYAIAKQHDGGMGDLPAPVDEEEQAAATSTWAFTRTVGGIRGVAEPATILNNSIQASSLTILDPSAREAFRMPYVSSFWSRSA
ncbi:hypothetical protein CC78DRAFT_584646 [Lojkania enalia]|uniref:Uncharacterized protein n=1 Tax=Lojkania enalia TaxID=147567 RepID=A0A9P4K721_9PLEO|nr:hypothetical protein CC78DRAFT_584646 [Didymosphaeria enalia]